jgi:hypothetical protein
MVQGKTIYLQLNVHALFLLRFSKLHLFALLVACFLFYICCRVCIYIGTFVYMKKLDGINSLSMTDELVVCINKLDNASQQSSTKVEFYT